jgi:hypothetical protein
VANCDLDSSPNQSMLENGAPDVIALVFNTTTNTTMDQLVDSVSYEGNTAQGPSRGGLWTEGSGVGLIDDGLFGGAGIARFPDGQDTQRNNVDLACHDITPGAANVAADGACTASGVSAVR